MSSKVSAIKEPKMIVSVYECVCGCVCECNGGGQGGVQGRNKSSKKISDWTKSSFGF